MKILFIILCFLLAFLFCLSMCHAASLNDDDIQEKFIKEKNSKKKDNRK